MARPLFLWGVLESRKALFFFQYPLVVSSNGNPVSSLIGSLASLLSGV